ncbi:MAG: DinB family protein [Opitutaceae bacterium]|nr:DinB family protein [Opitutaceae bacterium]
MPNEHLRTAALAILDQGLDLLATLSPADYRQSLPQAFNASIGGHYRHCLDHFECLLAAPDNAIDYDARRRDERIEREPAFAAERTRQLAAALRALPDARLDAFISVRCKVAYSGCDSPLVPSTVARELMYAIVHAVHHYALIGVMCRLLEVPLTPGFGIAPSTVQHRAATPAA